MGGMSIWHWIVVGLVVMLLFGRGKISDLMGDVAKGIKAFKKGMNEDDTVVVTPATGTVQPAVAAPARPLDHVAPAPAHPTVSTAPVTTDLGERKLG